MSNDHIISIRLDDDMYRELVGIADELGISLSRCASTCLRIYLENQNEENIEEDLNYAG